MSDLSWREFDRAFTVWWWHHYQWPYRKAMDEFSSFTGLSSVYPWRIEPSEEQVERVRKLAGPYGPALLAIHLAKEGLHHGTGQ